MSKLSDLASIFSDIGLSEGATSLFKAIGYLARSKNENSVGQMMWIQHEKVRKLEIEVALLKYDIEYKEKVQQLLRIHPNFTESELKSLLLNNPQYNCEELATLLKKFPNYTITELDEYMKKNTSRSKGAKK